MPRVPRNLASWRDEGNVAMHNEDMAMAQSPGDARGKGGIKLLLDAS